MLASPGSHLRAVALPTESVYGFESDLGGQRSVLLVNAALTPQSLVVPDWFRAGWPMQIDTYSAASSADSEPIVGSTAPWSSKVSLPGESIVVLSGSPNDK